MLPAIAVPVFDGKGSLPLHDEQDVGLWCQVANVEPAKRASALILRKKCVSSGEDVIINNDGAQQSA